MHMQIVQNPKNISLAGIFANFYDKVKVKSLSCVRLYVTPWTVAYHAPPSMGFSRQESGVVIRK